MGIRMFFKAWRDKRFAKYVAKETLEEINETDSPPPEFSDIVKSEEQPMLPERDTKEHGEVTGFYKTVSASIQEVIDGKKETQRAAKRITNAIGAPPEPKRRKK